MTEQVQFLMTCKVPIGNELVIDFPVSTESITLGAREVQNLKVDININVDCLADIDKHWYEINRQYDKLHAPSLPCKISSLNCKVEFAEIEDEVKSLITAVGREFECIPEGTLGGYVRLPNDAPGKYERWLKGQYHWKNIQNEFERNELATAKLRILADTVYDNIFETVNRFISWVRTEKKQYWLQELRVHEKGSFLNWPTGYARVDKLVLLIDGVQETWLPPDRCIEVAAIDLNSALRAEDLDACKSFLFATKRPNLVRSLLMESRLLASQGHERVALTQAVTALEIALHAFAKSPIENHVLPAELKTRMDMSLAKTVSHLGFSTSIKMLLPLLFSEEQISTATLKFCQSGIDQRNQIIHNGTRRVNEPTKTIDAVESLCDFLQPSTIQHETKVHSPAKSL